MDVKDIPRIGSRVYITATAPFDSIVYNNILYEISSIRTIVDMINEGVDVYTQLYEPMGLPQTVLDADIANGVVIVGITSDAGTIYIPSNRMSITVSKDTVPYVERVLIVPLGALPNEMDLSFLKDEVTSTVRDMIGLNTTPEITTVSAVTDVDKATHDAFMTTLTNNKVVNKSLRVKLQEAQASLDHANQLIAQFQCYIQQYGCQNGVSTLNPTNNDMVDTLLLDSFARISNGDYNAIYNKYGNI